MGSSGLKARIPNAITMLRLVLAAAFFVVLARYQFPLGGQTVLYVALGLFVVAALTDALDGALARRWNVVSPFGRIMDPFADKVLVLGAFVMLAGPGFTLYEGWGGLGMSSRQPQVLAYHASGVEPWMVVVILARELLVTTIRAVFESRGIDFSASLSGKVKMVVQSIGVPGLLLLCVLAQPDALAWINSSTAGVDRPSASLHGQIAYWSALGITALTALSAVPYITRAISALRPSSETPS